MRFSFNCVMCGRFCQRHGAWNAKFCLACCNRHQREGRRAISRVKAAVIAGRLPPVAGQLCEDCGVAATDYDHRDYTLPLDVHPVCRSCNLKRGHAFNSFWRPQPVAA